MKILIVGGSGMIGGHAALYLGGKGHEVAIASRNPPPETSPLSQLEFIRCDYLTDKIDAAKLGSFDALVFAAGNDIRHLPPETDPDAHWQRANSEGIPEFLTAARDAGVKQAVLVGSFYPQAAPEIAESDSYARSRKVSDERSLALASPTFQISSVNAPFVVGSVTGLVSPMLMAYANYALGRIPDLPEFAPPGGVNFISTSSLSEAIEGALLRGENGKAYLLGDENMSFEDYFGAFFKAAGRTPPKARDQEHPMLPDAAILWGRGESLFYEVSQESQDLGFRRNDIVRTIREIVAQYRDHPAA